MLWKSAWKQNDEYWTYKIDVEGKEGAANTICIDQRSLGICGWLKMHGPGLIRECIDYLCAANKMDGRQVGAQG